MPRPTPAALLMAAILIALSAAPKAASRAAAASCSSWTSETQPPPTIRVYRTATGDVETVDFRVYAKNVLSREWISSWTTESLRSGALAVKNYAWYQVLHWRGYVNAGGQCFDVFDSSRDQVYDPSLPTWGSAAAAVEATWSTLALQDGHIFAAYYNAGTPHEACGANANGWRMYQWGTQACGQAGLTAARIMATYYTGVVVSGAPPAAIPTPTPGLVPSATPVPATPTPTVSTTSAPDPSGAPEPTAATAAPTPALASTPSASPASAAPDPQPGGGQAGVRHVSTPPPPPPPRPKPIVMAPRRSSTGATQPPGAESSTTAAAPSRPALRIPEGADVPAEAVRARGDLRLSSFRVLFAQAMQRLGAALADDLFANDAALLPALLPRRNLSACRRASSGTALARRQCAQEEDS